jgi:Fe2+ or Zn2+ uptake regulation protein
MPLREEILREITASHRAIGAYEVREKLKAKGRDIQAMSIYITIEVCIHAGVIRRFEKKRLTGLSWLARNASVLAMPTARRRLE